MVAALVVGAGLALAVAAMPDLRLGATPFKGRWSLSLSPAVLPALAFAAVLTAWGPALAARLRWGPLLAVTTAATAVWSALLAASEGAHRLAAPLDTRWDLLAAVDAVDSPGRFLDSFVARLADLPLHVKSHPPGGVLVLWLLDVAGLRGPGWAALLVIVAGASASTAALVVARELAGAAAARRVAPFLVAAPAVLWLATSMDALYLGVGAWSVALAVVASGRPSPGWRLPALAGGLLAGAGLLLSYGVVLLGAVAAVVPVVRRRVDVALAYGAAALVPVLAAAAAGFWWLDGLDAARRYYRLGVAADRSYGWFLAVNVVAFAAAVGPAAIRGLVRRGWGSPTAGLVPVVAAGLVAVALADASGLSKGEVERIWLPFVPWVVLAAAAVPPASVRRWLGASVATTLALQLTLRSPW